MSFMTPQEDRQCLRTNTVTCKLTGAPDFVKARDTHLAAVWLANRQSGRRKKKMYDPPPYWKEYSSSKIGLAVLAAVTDTRDAAIESLVKAKARALLAV